MIREEIIKRIVERLEYASDADLESIYWMVEMELDI